MKKIFVLLSVLLIVGAGCTTRKITVPETYNIQNTNIESKPTEKVDPMEEQEKNIREAQKKLPGRLAELEKNFTENKFIPSTTAFYGWSLSTDPSVKYDLYTYNLSPHDCVSVYNRDTLGGDMLSSLAGDEELRAQLSLSLFSKKYIQELKDDVGNYVEKAYRTGFYAFYVCNLGKGVDLTIGNLWSTTTSPYLIEDISIKVTDAFFDHPIALIRESGNIVELKDIQLFGSTATGGETEPCDITLSDGIISWKCFAGLGDDTKNNTTYGKFQNSQIALDGTIIKNWETRN